MIVMLHSSKKPCVNFVLRRVLVLYVLIVQCRESSPHGSKYCVTCQQIPLLDDCSVHVSVGLVCYHLQDLVTWHQTHNTSGVLPGKSDLLPSTSDLLPRTSDLLPSTSDLLPRTSNLLPSTWDLLPNAWDLLPITWDLLPITWDLLPNT